jgi:hypothetical protein
MTKKPQVKPEDLGKKFRKQLDPALTEPVPDEWLEPLVRELYGQIRSDLHTHPFLGTARRRKYRVRWTRPRHGLRRPLPRQVAPGKTF